MEFDAEKIAKQFAENIKINTGIVLQYDKKSVKALEELIEQFRQFKSENAKILVQHAGVWLGECLRVLFGGKWQYDEKFKTWGVVFTGKEFKEIMAYPIAKACKQYENGLSDSVYGFVIGIERNFT